MEGSIESGSAADANEVMNALGANFIDNSQLLFNASYIGFDTRLANTGVPSLDNVLFSIFTADDADTNIGFLYDSTNDMYETPDLTTGLTEYIIIEATSLSASWNANDVRTIEYTTGKWLVFCTVGTDAVRRAQIHKSLWYGTDGTDALMDDFTTVTAVKTSHTNDVDKRATLAKLDATDNASSNFTGTFNDTTTNNNSSIWSRVFGNWVGGSGGTHTIETEFAVGNVINSCSHGSNSSCTSDEFGLDKSADELTNPADVKLDNNGPGVNIITTDIDVVILHEGTITWVPTGAASTSEKDYTTDDAIPVMVAAGTLAAEGVGLINTLIFKDTASATVTNAIPSINSTIDATSTEQISISADAGVTFTNVNNGEIARATPTGTGLQRKIVITRATLDKLDKVTEQAVKFNYY